MEEEKGNGAEKHPPTILLGWHAEHQDVQLTFNPEDFKTWGFVKAVLRMALDKAEQSERLANAAKMQQVMADQQLKQRLFRGH